MVLEEGLFGLKRNGKCENCGQRHSELTERGKVFRKVFLGMSAAYTGSVMFIGAFSGLPFSSGYLAWMGGELLLGTACYQWSEHL